MTTIAFDGVTLAFDSRITIDSCVMGNSDKSVQSEEFIGAIAGDFVSIPILRKWVKAGLPVTALPKLKKGTDYLMVLVRKSNRQILVFENNFEPMTLDDKTFASGSGHAYAYGALHAGATAKQAVQAAAQYDGCTGGRVRTLELEASSAFRP